MAEMVPITTAGPRLEGVLGPLGPDEERELRDLVLSTSSHLVDLARQLGGRAGWHGDGLELEWVPSGQMSIWAAVEASDSEKHAVAFIAQLRPGWYDGEPEAGPTWVVEISIEVDCLHTVDHAGMETVLDSESVAYSPREAVQLLGREVGRLTEFATEQPLEHWTSRTRD